MPDICFLNGSIVYRRCGTSVTFDFQFVRSMCEVCKYSASIKHPYTRRFSIISQTVSTILRSGANAKLYDVRILYYERAPL